MLVPVEDQGHESTGDQEDAVVQEGLERTGPVPVERQLDLLVVVQVEHRLVVVSVLEVDGAATVVVSGGVVIFSVQDHSVAILSRGQDDLATIGPTQPERVPELTEGVWLLLRWFLIEAALVLVDGGVYYLLLLLLLCQDVLGCRVCRAIDSFWVTRSGF